MTHKICTQISPSTDSTAGIQHTASLDQDADVLMSVLMWTELFLLDFCAGTVGEESIINQLLDYGNASINGLTTAWQIRAAASNFLYFWLSYLTAYTRLHIK